MAESWCVLEAKQQRINGIHTNKGSYKGKFRRSIPNRWMNRMMDRHHLEWNVILKGWGNAISEKLTGTFTIKIVFEGLYVQQKTYLSKFPSFALVDFNHVSRSTSTIVKPFCHTVSCKWTTITLVYNNFMLVLRYFMVIWYHRTSLHNAVFPLANTNRAT